MFFPLNLQITKVKIEQIEPPRWQRDFTSRILLHKQPDAESSSIRRKKFERSQNPEKIEIPSRDFVNQSNKIVIRRLTMMKMRRIRIKRSKALSNQKSEEATATVRAKQSNPIESKKNNNRICYFGEKLDGRALGFGANLFDRRQRKLRARIAKNSSSWWKQRRIWSDSKERRCGSKIGDGERELGLERLEPHGES